MNKIALLRKEKGYTQEQFSKLIGVGRSTLAMYETDKSEPDFKILKKIADVLNVTTDYLLDREAEKASDSSRAQVYFPSENITVFEVIGNVTAGYDGIISEEFTGDMQEVPSSLLRGHDKTDFFVLNVKGNSMYPQFLEGDKVLVERCSSVDSGAVAVVLYNDEEVTIKKVNYVKGQNWLELIPRNPEYPVKRIENEDLAHCRVLGKVVYLFRMI